MQHVSYTAMLVQRSVQTHAARLCLQAVTQCAAHTSFIHLMHRTTTSNFTLIHQVTTVSCSEFTSTHVLTLKSTIGLLPTCTLLLPPTEHSAVGCCQGYAHETSVVPASPGHNIAHTHALPCLPCGGFNSHCLVDQAQALLPTPAGQQPVTE